MAKTCRQMKVCIVLKYPLLLVRVLVDSRVASHPFSTPPELRCQSSTLPFLTPYLPYSQTSASFAIRRFFLAFFSPLSKLSQIK